MHYLTSMLLDFSLTLDVAAAQMNRNGQRSPCEEHGYRGPRGQGPAYFSPRSNAQEQKEVFLHMSDITHLQ